MSFVPSVDRKILPGLARSILVSHCQMFKTENGGRKHGVFDNDIQTGAITDG